MSKNPTEIQDRLRSAWKLYSLPQTLAEVIRITDDDGSCPDDLASIVLRDPPLTARLLRLANSAVYGRTHQVTTVNQAVVLLGFRAVKSLTLSTSVYDVFSDDSRFSVEDLKQFWGHSLEIALYAQLFASRIDYPVPEEAFVAGLIHDLGMVVLGKMLPDSYSRLVTADRKQDEISKVEENYLGINHAEAAALLFTDWGLPEVLVEAVRHHHRVRRVALEDDTPRLTLLVEMADMMSRHHLVPPPTADAQTVGKRRAIAERLGLSVDDLKEVDAWVTANLSVVAQHLEVDIGSPVEVLCNANDRLFELYLDVEGLVLNRQEAVRREIENEKQVFASEVLRVVAATFAHYINNATTTIMGHSQLVEMALQQTPIGEAGERITQAMKTIQNSVLNITAVLDELKESPVYKVVSYHERCKILDVDKEIKRRIADLVAERSPSAPA